MVENALLFHDQTRYDLQSWVIMPNHAHVLFDPKPSVSLSNIMKDFKGFAARQANKMLKSSGTIWHPDYFDTYIRNQKHYDTVVAYIENNPVIAGLCAEPGDWPFGSARFAANNAAKL